MVKKVPADAGQKTLSTSMNKPFLLTKQSVQVQLQEVLATSKQIINELMILQEELHEQLKVATDMFYLDRGSEL